jgi:hypothetical protein
VQEDEEKLLTTKMERHSPDAESESQTDEMMNFSLVRKQKVFFISPIKNTQTASRYCKDTTKYTIHFIISLT